MQFKSLKEKFNLQKLKVFFLRKEFITNALAWYGLYDFITQGPHKARRIAFLYLLTHRNKKLRARLVNELIAQPDCAKFINEKKRITTSLDFLSTLPKDTLGEKFYRHLQENNIKLVVPMDAAIKNEFQYIIHRLLITHDIYHTLLEAPTTVYGEAIVAAFTYAQIPSYAPPLVHVAAGTLHYATKNHALIDRGNLGVIIGWLLGKSAPQLFSVDWDALWALPISDVRKKLHIDLIETQNKVKQFYNPDKKWVHTVPNIPTTIDEHLNNDTCIKETLLNDNLKIENYLPTNNEVKAVVILGRAMFTSGRYLQKTRKPSLTSCLIDQGIQVLIPIEDNKQKQLTNFDQMIAQVAKTIAFAKKIQPNKPLFLIGHSLSGLSFLVSQGLISSKDQVAGIVTLGAATWNKDYLKEANLRTKLRFHLNTTLIRFLATMFKFVPAHLLLFGDYDEHRDMVKQVIIDNMTKGKWQSSDQQQDFYALLNAVDCPVFSVSSHADKYASPRQVKLFHQHLKKNPEWLIVDHLSHMDLGASENAWLVWEQVAQWIKTKAQKNIVSNKTPANQKIIDPTLLEKHL